MKFVKVSNTKSQRIISQLLLAGFLLESCNNANITPHLQQKEERIASSHYHLRPSIIDTNISPTIEQVDSLNQGLFGELQVLAKQQALHLTNSKYPEITLQDTYAKSKLKSPAINNADIKRQAKANHAMASLLKNHIYVVKGGLQIKFKVNIEGGLQAIVKNSYFKGVPTQTLPVIIEPGFSYLEETVKNSAWQKQYIHVTKNYVYIGHLGLVGGGKHNKEKEDELDSETDDDEVDIEAQGELGEDEFQIQNIQNFIEEGTRNAKEAKGKEIILVLGNTGCGKSTIINYLLGSELEQADNDEGDVIARPKDPQQEWAKIGHSLTSETCLPSVYSNSASLFTYCDCPGFNDTRTEQEQLKTSIATQLIINCAARIRGIIIVIDVQDLIHSRGNSMRALSLTLSQLLDGNIKPNSILFVFNNKLPSGSGAKKDLENMHKKIAALIKAEKDKLQQITKQRKAGNNNNEELERTNQILAMLNRISDQKDNTIQIELFDQFESKNQIERLLENLKLTKKKYFNFSKYDDTRAKFNQQLDDIVRDISSKLIPFVLATKNMYINMEKMESCEELIDFYQAQLDSLNPEEDNQQVSKIQELQQHIQTYNQKITKLEQKKEASQNNIDNLKKEKTELDTDEEVCYWTYNAYGDADIQYNGPPFSRRYVSWIYGDIPSIAKRRGVRFESEFIDKEGGIYRAIFKHCLFFFNKEQFYVNIYVKKKNIPDNKARIEQINKEVEQEKKLLQEYSQEVEEAQFARNHFQDLLACYTTNIQEHKKQIIGRKQFLEEQLGRMQRERESVRLKSSEQEKIKKDAVDYLASKHNLITAVYSLILQGIGNVSSLTDTFKLYYQDYSSFSNQDTGEESSKLEIDFPENLVCPIAGVKFIDPVITKCGHTFNFKDLFSWLSRKENCPTCRQSVSTYELTPNLSIRQAVEEFEAEKIKQYTIALES